MNQAILNIGLSVGDAQPTDQLNRTLLHLMGFDSIVNLKVAPSKNGNWNLENTLVVAIENTMGEQYFKDLLSVLCTRLNQDAISYKTSSGQCGLVFNGNYKGEKFKFNPDYFITF